jgi:hypothetical protein
VFQPWQNYIVKASAERGGNSMGLTENDGPSFVLENWQMWLRGRHEDMTNKMGRNLVQRLRADADVKSPGKYSPFFMNDANSDQNVFASYRDVAKFRAVQKSIDPTGFWQRGGGFKII